MDDSSNRRKTRSSGRKKASTKVAESQDTSQIPDGAEAKSKPNGASPGRSSPEPDCAICLGRLQNKSFTDRCFHMFCFVCLQEWSKVKAECPLCKQKFTSIIHNVRSNEDYDQYPIPPKIPSWEEQARNFRYHTTLTLERRLQINIPDFRQHPQYLEHDYTLQRPSHHNHMTTRSHWRRQRQTSSSDFRRRIYTNNLRLVEVTDPRMRTRDTTPNFFSRNPACTHRLVPWLNRELNALLQSQHDNVQFVLELIMGLIKRMAITSEDFYQGIYPYIGRYTRHFMQEFENFAKSPYNIAAYDQHAVYQPQTLAVESDSDTDSILSVGDDDNDDVIVISPSQETGRRRQPSPPHRQPSPPHRQRESTSLTYRDLSPLLHRVRSLLEYPTGSHLSVNTPGWDSPTPGPSWAAETELSDSSAAVTTAEEETVLDDGIRMMGDAQTTVKTEEECEIDVENTGSNSSSDDSDSDSSKAGSDIVFVGYDRPWQERSPILLSSTDEDNVVSQHTSSSTVDRKSRHRGDTKPRTDRHKKHSSDFSRDHWRTSKRRRTRSRSRSRSSSRHGHHWRRRSRSRSRYMSDHRRRRSRSRSRERSGSKRKRTSSPSSFDHSFIYNRSRASSSLLSWDNKRNRSKSSSVEITYVKRKKSKHKKKEKKHHKKHRSRKHKKRRRASDSEDSQEDTSRNVSRPRSLVSVVNKPKQVEQKSEECYDKEIGNETPKKDISTSDNSSTSLQSKPLVPDSPIVSSAQSITSETKSLDSTTTGSSDSKVSCTGSSESKTPPEEPNIKKPYKKHPTGHKKSSQNKSASADSTSSSLDLNHTTSTESCPDSAQTSKSQELSPLVKDGTNSGPSTQSSESSDGDINEAPDSTDQGKHTEEVHINDASSCTVQSSCMSSDELDSKKVDDHSNRNEPVPDDVAENPKDNDSIDVSGDTSCISDSYRRNNSSDNTESGGQCKTDHNSAGQESTSASLDIDTSNSEHSNQTLSTDVTDQNKNHQCALHSTDISPEVSGNPESSFNLTDDRPSSEDTTDECQRSPCMFGRPEISGPRLGHQISTIEILDSDSSLNSDSDIDVEDLLDCEGNADSGRTNNHGRSCVIVEPPQNVAIRYPSDSATDYPRYSSDHDEISSSSAMSDANIFSNTNTSQSQPSSPCLYSSPNLMYNNPMGTNLAISSFNGLFHSSSASIMRTDSFVSNMAVSISTAGVQSQHMTNHVYRASPGGQWESHHSAHSISRANMGNVELVQTMSGVAHNNLYGSTRSATSSTMAYIPHTTSGQYLPNVTSVQTYTNTQQSYMSTTGPQYSTTSSPSRVLSNASPQANCSLSRNLLPIEGNSRTSLSPLPSYFTSSGSPSLWSQDRHIEVADSSDGDTDVDVLFLSDNEDEFREINIMDITDEEESDDEGSHVDLISDDSDVEIEEAPGPTDSVYENMIPAVLPHGSVSEEVLEDDAERTRRTTCDLSVCVSDDEDKASHSNERLQCASSSSEEDNDLLDCASSSEDKINGPHFACDKAVSEEEKFSSHQNDLSVLKSCESVSDECYNKAQSVDCHSSGSKEKSDKPVSSNSDVSCQESGSGEESDKPEMSNSGVSCQSTGSNDGSDEPIPSSSSVCHHSGSQEELDIQVPTDWSVGCQSSGSEESDKPASSSSNVVHDTGSQEHSTGGEGNNIERNIDTDNRICNLSCREDVTNENCDTLDRDSMCGSSDSIDRNTETCGSSESQSFSKDTESYMCDGSDKVSDSVEVSEKLVEDQKSLEDCSTVEPTEGTSYGNDTETVEQGQHIR